MPRYVIERTVTTMPSPEDLAAGSRKSIEVCNEMGLRWIRSYISEEGGKIYCEYEAPNAELVREHARRVGLPADRVSLISVTLDPSMFV